MNIRAFLLAAALLLLPAVSAAQDRAGVTGSGFYASLTGAWVVPTDSTLSASGQGHKVSTNLEFDSGFGVVGAFGYRFGGGFGAEFEIGYRSADFDKFSGLKISGPVYSVRESGKAPVDGDIGVLSFMANAVYSFRLWKVHPYLGAGAGAARLDATFGGNTYAFRYTFEGDTLTDTLFVKGGADAWAFAYQAMVGVGYPVSESVEIRAGYRYFGTSEADFDIESDYTVKANFAAHNFEAGILFRF